MIRNCLKKKEVIFFNKSDLLEKEEIEHKLRIFKSKIKKTYKIISVFNDSDIKIIKKQLLSYAN